MDIPADIVDHPAFPVQKRQDELGDYSVALVEARRHGFPYPNNFHQTALLKRGQYTDASLVADPRGTPELAQAQTRMDIREHAQHLNAAGVGIAAESGCSPPVMVLRKLSPFWTIWLKNETIFCPTEPRVRPYSITVEGGKRFPCVTTA